MRDVLGIKFQFYMAIKGHFHKLFGAVLSVKKGRMVGESLTAKLN
jgi:hypothetical protein